MLPGLLNVFRSLPDYRGALERLPARGHAVSVAGVPGSSAAVLVAALVDDLPQRIVAVVAPGPAEA